MACPEGPPSRTAREAMSLTDLRGEVLEKMKETLKVWDAQTQESLAGLQRQVVGILGHYLVDMGRDGPDRSPCP